jgi:hypothetical protein
MSLLGHVKLLYFQRCDMFLHSCALMDNFPGRSSEYHSQLYESTFQCDVMTKMQAQFREQFRLVTVIGHGIGGKHIPIMARLTKVRRWNKR